MNTLNILFEIVFLIAFLVVGIWEAISGNILTSTICCLGVFSEFLALRKSIKLSKYIS